MDSKDPEIKIVDKRRFNSDGDKNELQDKIKEEKREECKGGSKTCSSKKKDSEPQKEEYREVTFSDFVMSLSTQILTMLGEIPVPGTNEISVNLDAAKQSIDILDMLSKKTVNNRTQEEDRLITEIVPSLQMAFVKKVNELKKR